MRGDPQGRAVGFGFEGRNAVVLGAKRGMTGYCRHAGGEGRRRSLRAHADQVTHGCRLKRGVKATGAPVDSPTLA